MMKRLEFALAVAAAVLGPQPIMAQTTPIRAGTRIRVSFAHDDRIGSAVNRPGVVGRLDRTGADSIWLRIDPPDGPLLTIDRTYIDRLEISGGRKRNPVRGALWGAGVGLGIGLLTAATLDDCTVRSRHWSFDLCRGNEDVLIVGDMVAGAAAGALVGLFITSERWLAIPPASLVLAVRPDTRLGIALRLPLRGHRADGPPARHVRENAHDSCTPGRPRNAPVRSSKGTEKNND
jgi:hypothetical protein